MKLVVILMKDFKMNLMKEFLFFEVINAEDCGDED